MSNQIIKSDLFVDLSADEQQLLSGGQMSKRNPIICYSCQPYRGRRNVDVDVDVNVERRRRRREV
jgi:hypothetical protein